MDIVTSPGWKTGGPWFDSWARKEIFILCKDLRLVLRSWHPQIPCVKEAVFQKLKAAGGGGGI